MQNQYSQNQRVSSIFHAHGVLPANRRVDCGEGQKKGGPLLSVFRTFVPWEQRPGSEKFLEHLRPVISKRTNCFGHWWCRPSVWQQYFLSTGRSRGHGDLCLSFLRTEPDLALGMQQKGLDVLGLELDIAQKGSIERLHDRVLREIGRLVILVNSRGT